MAEDQTYWTESQIALVEQARDATQLAAKRAQTSETRLGNVEERVQLVDESVARRQQEIEAAIADNVPAHQWDGSSLRLKNPDGEWGAWIDLVGAAGAAGWTPQLAMVADGAREVLSIQDWVGGAGPKPSTGYLGASGLVSDISVATNLRGSGGPTGPAPTLTVGTVTTGAPETDVIFDIHAVSPGVYEVDVTIPEGKEGEPGLDGGSTAALVEFDNASNGFTADDVQAAIEELNVKLGAVPVGVQLLTTSGLYTRSPGVTRALIIAVGGGQAGGGINAATGGYPGGSSGEVRLAVIAPDATENVTIAAGGVGSTSSSGPSGGDTIFGAFLTAKGGGGTAGSGGVLLDKNAGGSGGSSGAPTFAGSGGNTALGFGAGGKPRLGSNGPGLAASGFGAGGGGAGSGTYTTYNGGNGGAGCILVLEFK